MVGRLHLVIQDPGMTRTKDRQITMSRSKLRSSSITASEVQLITSAGRTRFAKGVMRISGSTSRGQRRSWEPLEGVRTAVVWEGLYASGHQWQRQEHARKAEDEAGERTGPWQGRPKDELERYARDVTAQAMKAAKGELERYRKN
jgi:hypothetical protein